MVIALKAGNAAALFHQPALCLAVSAKIALLSTGLSLFETSRITPVTLAAIHHEMLVYCRKSSFLTRQMAPDAL